MLEQGENVRRKERQRGAVTDRPQRPVLPAPLRGGGRRRRSWERRNDVEPGKKGCEGGREGGLVFVFFSYHLTLF